MVLTFLDDFVRSGVESALRRKLHHSEYIADIYEGGTASLSMARNAQKSFQEAKERYDAANKLATEQGISFTRVYFLSR